MSKNTFMKILGAVGVAGTALVTAGILPGALAVAFTVLTGVAGWQHTSPVAK